MTGKWLVLLLDKDGAARDHFLWQRIKGEATDVGDFGDAVNDSAEYHVPELPLTTPVTVQLLIDDGLVAQCWQSIFSVPPTKNDAAKCKAKD